MQMWMKQEWLKLKEDSLQPQQASFSSCKYNLLFFCVYCVTLDYKYTDESKLNVWNHCDKSDSLRQSMMFFVCLQSSDRACLCSLADVIGRWVTWPFVSSEVKGLDDQQRKVWTLFLNTTNTERRMGLAQQKHIKSFSWSDGRNMSKPSANQHEIRVRHQVKLFYKYINNHYPSATSLSWHTVKHVISDALSIKHKDITHHASHSDDRH